MSALTPDFLGKALETWRLTAPGIIVDCIEMDSELQERALLETGGRCRCGGFEGGLPFIQTGSI
jgi:hypothetical protein